MHVEPGRGREQTAGAAARNNRVHRAPVDRADRRRGPATSAGFRARRRARRGRADARDLYLCNGDREAGVQRRM